MNENHKRLSHFNNIIFLKYFKFVLIFVLCLIIVCCFIIDSIMLTNVKQKNIFETDSITNQLSKVILSDSALIEALSLDSSLHMMLLEFPNVSPLEQLMLSGSIRDLLEGAVYSAPEISNIELYTTAPYDFNFVSLRSLNDFTGTNWYDCFNISGITLYDKFSQLPQHGEEKLDTERLSIICPIPFDAASYSWYICASISKDYLYNTYMNTQDSKNEYYVLDNHGYTICSGNLSLLGSVFPNKAVAGFVQRKRSDSRILRYSNGLYLASCSETNDYGWKTITLKPLSNVITWRGTVIVSALLLLIVLAFISYKLSNIFADLLTSPLSKLIKAMKNSSAVSFENIDVFEIQELYQGYNSLIDENNALFFKLKEQQQQVIDAEMRSLITQINPHFLYNTLNAISWKAMDSNRPDICSLLAKLGKLYRLNCKFTSPFCTLQDEITHISLYMDLQKECFNSSFDYSIDVSDDSLKLMVPKFILQPIIENSIIHGFSQRINSGNINVAVTIDSNLVITIQDNGIGMESETLEKLNTSNYFSEKYGIHNISERIKLSCGESYGITFESHSCIGTTATIVLPVKYQENI